MELNPNQSSHPYKQSIYLNLKQKSDILSRLNRIEGQIRGVQGQVERNEYCDQVLIQLAAIHSALNAVGKLLLANHFKSCLISRVLHDDETIIAEMLQTMKILMK